MLARVAENLYWLGRLLERADNIARLADVDFAGSLEAANPGGVSAGEAAINALGARVAYEVARAADPALDPRSFIVFSPSHQESLRSTVTCARTLARELREHLSREVFEELNRLHLHLDLDRDALEMDPASDFDLQAYCSAVKRSVATIFGLVEHTMLATEGTCWFRAGAAIERADMTSRVVDTKYFVLLPSAEDIGGPLDRFQWMAMLRSVSALEAFRKRYRERVSGPRVVDLLVFDPAFPRSLSASVHVLEGAFEEATRDTPAIRRRAAQREILTLRLDLETGNAELAIRQGLHEFLDDFQRRLSRVDAALASDVFRAVPEERAG